MTESINYNMLKDRKYKEVGINEELSSIRFGAKTFKGNRYIAPNYTKTLAYVLTRISKKNVEPKTELLTNEDGTKKLNILQNRINEEGEFLKFNKELKKFEDEKIFSLTNSIVEEKLEGMFKNDELFEWAARTKLREGKHGIFVCNPVKMNDLFSWWSNRSSKAKVSVLNINVLISLLVLFNELKEYAKSNEKRVIHYLSTKNYFKPSLENWEDLNELYDNEEVEIILSKAKQGLDPYEDNIRVPVDEESLKVFSNFLLTEDLDSLFEYGLEDIFNFYVFFGHAIFNMYLEDAKNLDTELSIFSNASSDYAKTYEDLKNKPDQIIEAAKTTVFNNHFKKVEFDGDVDLSKLKSVEEDFLNFIGLFEDDQFNMKDTTLRFRKLGKYNSQGLYFPFYNTLVVDPRSTNSFVHEFFHMIDFNTNKKLSRSVEFLILKDAFVEKTLEQLELFDNKAFKKSWNGNTKYNKDYYLNDAEIFARIGEIYIKRILKFTNNLIKRENSRVNNVLYPDSERINELIEKFFSKEFKVKEINALDEKEKNVIDSNLDTDNVVEMKEMITDDINEPVNGQISVWDLLEA